MARSIGKSGGLIVSPKTCATLTPSSCDGAWIVTEAPSVSNGVKNGNPWM